MKNILVIAYYFPPMGGSGVQRTLKFVKYLRAFDWNPIVLCPEPGAYPWFDQSLSDELESFQIEVIRVKARTPFHLLGKLKKNIQMPSGTKASVFRSLSRLFYYPDNKTAWIKPAVTKAEELIEQYNPEVLFCTAPPFSNHIIGKRLSEQTGLPLVLDYRDSWAQNHFMKSLFGWQRKRMQKMEYQCLNQARAIVVLDSFMQEGIKDTYPGLEVSIEIIPHGFDPDDFKNRVEASLIYKKNTLNWLYSGLFYESNQPDLFLEAVQELGEEIPEFLNENHFHFQGGIDERIKTIVSKLGLEEYVTNYGYLDHAKAAVNLRQADVLWMISDFDPKFKQVKSGKLFEYFGTMKPILGIVHEGSSSDFLTQYGAGFTARPDNKEEIKEKIRDIYNRWKQNQPFQVDKNFVDSFDRKKLTEQLAKLFDKAAE